MLAPVAHISLVSSPSSLGREEESEWGSNSTQILSIHHHYQQHSKQYGLIIALPMHLVLPTTITAPVLAPKGVQKCKYREGAERASYR